MPQCSTIPAQEPRILYLIKRITCNNMFPKWSGFVFCFPIEEFVTQIFLIRRFLSHLIFNIITLSFYFYHKLSLCAHLITLLTLLQHKEDSEHNQMVVLHSLSVPSL